MWYDEKCTVRAGNQNVGTGEEVWGTSLALVRSASLAPAYHFLKKEIRS
jgi:hypothetical protein